VAVIDRDPDQGARHHFWPRSLILGYASSAGYKAATRVDDISGHLIVLLKPSAN
jgi:hypothetical protein